MKFWLPFFFNLLLEGILDGNPMIKECSMFFIGGVYLTTFLH